MPRRIVFTRHIGGDGKSPLPRECSNPHYLRDDAAVAMVWEFPPFGGIPLFPGCYGSDSILWFEAVPTSTQSVREKL